MTNNNYNEFFSSFLTTYLPRLPDEILMQIFDLFNRSDLWTFLTNFPHHDLRDLVLHHYYSEVAFIVHSEVSWYHRYFLDITQFFNEEIFEFMDTFPENIPRRLIITFDNESFSTIEQFLERYDERIRKVAQLEIALERCQLGDCDLNYLLSFKNLTKIYVQNMNLSNTKIFDNTYWTDHPRLEEIILVQDCVDDWSSFRFPEKLKCLELVQTELDHKLIIPKSVKTLSISGSKLDSLEIFQNQHSCDSTQNLMEDQLPAGLRKLKLETTGIYDFNRIHWPTSLEVLSLAETGLNDSALKIINNLHRWPPGLIDLNISNNPIRLPNFASRLPSNLKILEMNQVELSWLESEHPIEFPETLTELYMNACKIPGLDVLSFPTSLKKLALTTNQIEDVASYDWEILVNLETLDLSGNNITSLDDWMIPPNLINLCLFANPINELSENFPLFIDQYKFNLEYLDLRFCNIKSISVKYIPASLKMLILLGNSLGSNLVLPSSFKSLQHLNLCRCGLATVEFRDEDKQLTTPSPRRKPLDLPAFYSYDWKLCLGKIRKSTNTFHEECLETFRGREPIWLID
ncbi:uncharacterized protein SPAPADRAFT_60482 [Spathaspora passalidarum NRRL Y-27907]|uniref:F-box domain-containing protein n=1 Tax=Spathaspora passalidarum (strain NRRL Y-27907 / 11-Y1) TaxID=619300 RepID=G3ALD3_SPAPN|nr:uncharacterized protein SPAPADRAFT_60482 [Spathaspora passalidarum NRRL Y-27907]EGW33176.1 hypothetical protein SPAPADRAFT_60482 [Spathaspora passalidarum NRRL Y-27907]